METPAHLFFTIVPIGSAYTVYQLCIDIGKYREYVNPEYLFNLAREYNVLEKDFSHEELWHLCTIIETINCKVWRYIAEQYEARTDRKNRFKYIVETLSSVNNKHYNMLIGDMDIV